MRLKAVYDFVNKKLLNVPDDERRHDLYAHINGVANFSSIFALKRKLDPQIAITIALLHDIAAIIHNSYDDHAHLGAIIARDFLTALGSYTDDEIDIIATAIQRHTSDPRGFQRYDAILSEADFLQPYLHHFEEPKSAFGKNKLKELFAEINIEWVSADISGT